MGSLIDNLNFASNAKNYFLSLGFKSSILIADISILLLLITLIKEKISKIIFFYWLSPIVIYISYWHGQLDIFPTLILLLSLFFLKRKSYYISASMLGLSIACKISMLIAAPFICLYLFLNKRYYKIFWSYISILFITILLFQGLPFIDNGIRLMILNNPSINNVFTLSIPIAQNFSLHIVPVVYFILIMLTFRIGRMNFDLLYSFLGTCFFIFLVFTPAEIGWYLWVVPFLVYFQIKTDSNFFKYGIFMYSLFFVFNKIMIDEGSSIHFFNMDIYYLNKDLSQIILSNIEKFSYDLLKNISLIILSLIGFILSFIMVRKNIFDNNFFKLINKPILISIAGDSAVGKDTLGKCLGGIFGENSVASLNGDDYHLYERSSKKWEKITHLNPKANNLKQLENDSLNLKKGIPINCREYDHGSGKFTFKKIIKKKDFILLIGLHSIYTQKLRNISDIKIYLDVQENLRKYFKINRDIKKRNYNFAKIIKEINRRKKDSKVYIQKQKRFSDIIFRIDPIKKNFNQNYKTKKIDTRIKIILKNFKNSDLFINSLSKTVDKFDYRVNKRDLIVVLNSNSFRSNNFDTEIKKISKNLDEVLAIKPDYKNKEFGLMQFVTLFYIFNVIKNKRVSSRQILI